MKKIFAVYLLLSAIVSLAMEEFRIADNGIVTIGKVRLRLEHWDNGWNFSVQENGSFRADHGFPQRSANSFEWQGGFLLRKGGGFKLRETISGQKGGPLDYRAKISGTPSTRQFALVAFLPLTEFLYRQLDADGRKFSFPVKHDPARWMVSLGRVERLSIPLAEGLLTVSGPMDVSFFDDRHYKDHHSWSVRLSPPKESDPLNLHLRLSYRSYRSTPLDLSKVANMGFADEFDGDRRGGWSDQGAENDLADMPTGEMRFRGVRFRVIDPAENDGKSCLATYGWPRPYFPRECSISLPEPEGRYLYLLHALAWEPNQRVPVGALTAIYADGSRRHLPVISGDEVGNFWYPADRKRAVAVWFGKNRSCSRIGLFLTRYDFGKSGRVRELKLSSTGKSVWMIVAASLSPDEIPLQLGAPPKLVITAGKEYQPIRNNKRIIPGSILDFSRFQSAPAGKFGRVRNIDGRLEFEKRPGKAIRFYGGNICINALFAVASQQEKMARHMAQSGYNLARLHHFDRDLPVREGNDSTRLDPKKFERLDYLLKQLRDHGIYTIIDLFTLRTLRPGEIAELPNRAVAFNEFNALVFVSESAMRNWERFAENFLNHVNPHTGLAWKDDPSILSISLVNENTIDAAYRDAPITHSIYAERFEQYCRENSLIVTSMNRERLWHRFLLDLQHRAYHRQHDFLRRLGVKALLTDQNYCSSRFATLLREPFDLVETHSYWNHPRFIAGGWAPPSMVDNRSAITMFGGNFLNCAADRLFGKPFSLSEWDFCNPYDYAAEGAFLVGAYGALQNWNMVCRFDYTTWGSTMDREETVLDYFDIVNDPVRLLSERAGALFFARGDVAASQLKLPLLIDKKEMLERDSWRKDYPEDLRKMALICQVGSVITTKGRAVPEIGNVDATLQAGMLPPGSYDRVAQRFTSSTGELILNAKQGTFQVITPRSEAALLPEGKRSAGNCLLVSNRHGFGAFLAAAMDDAELRSSRRILLLHLTESRNSGQTFSSAEKEVMESWGTLPLLVRHGEAEITIRGDFRQHKLYAVDLTGARRQQLPLLCNDGKRLMFTASVLRNPAEPTLVYELVKE